MTRALQWLNFAGIAALAALCAVQWRTNRRLNLEIGEREKVRLEQVAQLAERDAAIKGYKEDLAEFRERLTLAESQLKDLDEKVAAMTRERNQLVAERDQLLVQRDQLKMAVDKWAAAVAARDSALKHAGEQLEVAVADRNEAVQKFNELAGKYNGIVKELNEARGKGRGGNDK